MDQLLDVFDEGYSLVEEYDSFPHKYGTVILYQTEAQALHEIGEKPGVTNHEIAESLRKSPSAISQIIRRLESKGWVEQVRDAENRRQYQLYLTEQGWVIFRDHDIFEQRCLQRTIDNLHTFSDADLMTYIQIQAKMNETFRIDIQESKSV